MFKHLPTSETGSFWTEDWSQTQVRTILEWSSTFPTADADSLVDRWSNIVTIAMVFIWPVNVSRKLALD